MRRLVWPAVVLCVAANGWVSQGQMSISMKMGAGAKTVTGLPYSADETVSTVLELPGGVRVAHAMKGHVWRATNGAERADATSDPTAVKDPKTVPATMVMLLDPAGHRTVFWTTKDKTAHLTRVPENTELSLRLLPPQMPPAVRKESVKAENITTTDLGRETRDGLALVGTRVTTTIPAGTIGNDAAIVTTQDRWVSPELKLLVREVDQDPWTGNRVMELTHIARTEPDAALFEVPAGYAVIESMQGIPSVSLGHKATEVPAEWVQRIADAQKATDPSVKNDVAYQLAMGRFAIADAHALADAAVGQAEREAAELSLKDADGMGFAAMERLSHYWVTLGLVYFREGQLDKAEAYMRASWELDPRGHVANHLGRVYEAEHRDADAIAVYRQALGARGSADLKQNVREQLGKMEGTAAQEPLPVDKTVPVTMAPMAGSAVFDILSSHVGIQEVVLVAGDAGFKSAEEAIRAALPTGIPDGGPERLLRRGRLSCAGASGCQLQLLTPQEARTALVSGDAGE
jgi:hypothetical protein